MSELHQQLAFFNELEKLKTVTRQNKTLDGRQENSAEHSWQLAVMAMTLQEHFPETVDIARVIRMLLLHDIGEIGAGDTSVFDEAGKAVSYEKELFSVQSLVSLLPYEQGQEYLELWKEFETEDSPEARYARCIDALAPLMNHLLIAETNENPDGLTKSQVLAKKAFIQNESPALWKLTIDLLEKSVEKGLYLEE